MDADAMCIRQHTLMKKHVLYFLALLIYALTFSSCTEEALDTTSINQQTIFVFMPWSGTASGSDGLYSYFKQNLDSINNAILKAGRMNGRALVFLSTSANKSELYEITLQDKKIQNVPIKEYYSNAYTTSEGIAQILNDVKSNAYALNYAMVVSCHGAGWTYKEDWNNYPYSSKKNVFTNRVKQNTEKYIPYYPTRFYGSVEDLNNYATNIETLENGISQAGMKMQFILFDDCYMANVETAYQLKNVTNFLVASTSEVMAIGMPYQTMWSSLASPTPDYQTITNDFYNFYSRYKAPYGTLSAIDCRQMDNLARIMKLINANDKFDSKKNNLDSLQVLDGFGKTIFYDMGDYVDSLCTNKDLLNDFHSTLAQAVRSAVHTDKIYSALDSYNGGNTIKIKRFSGITISDPSINSIALKGKEKTAWWKATH